MRKQPVPSILRRLAPVALPAAAACLLALAAATVAQLPASADSAQAAAATGVAQTDATAGQQVAENLPGLVTAIEEEAGLRISAPWYSVLIPWDELGEGFEYRLTGEVRNAIGEAAGLFDTHRLYVGLDSEKGTWFEVVCYDPAVTGSSGYVEALSAVESSDGLAVAVTTYPVGLDDNRWEAAQAAADRYASYIQPAVDAPGWAQEQSLETVELEDGSTLVETPWYAVELPAGMAQAQGFGLCYVEGLPAGYLGAETPDLGGASHVLYVATSYTGDRCETEHFELRCLPEGAEPSQGVYAVAETGVRTADGLWVYVYMPSGVSTPDGPGFAEALELARDYAARVHAVEPKAQANALETVELEGFVFEVPAYWQGRVEVTYGNGYAQVHLPGRPELALLTLVSCGAGEAAPSGGDISQWVDMYRVENGDRAVYATGINHGYLAGTGAWESGFMADWGAYDEALQRELVDLATGGLCTLEDAQADWGAVSGAVYDYLAGVLAAGLTA